MMFWIISVSIALLAAVALLWPILRQKAAMRNYGLAMILLIPLVALALYQKVGTPDGINVSGTPPAQQAAADHASTGAGEVDALLVQLEKRLQENPADLQGWVLLGRTYKTIQRYREAEAALVRAIQLDPADAMVLVELAEARLYASGNPVISDDIRGMLEQALMLDPDQQKGLWLLGLAASQSGNDIQAIELWERLESQLDPATGVATSVAEQMEMARSRLGVEEPAGWPGIDIEVSVDDPGFTAPEGSVLFIVARNPQAPGPPVGVRRIADPVFPVSINLNDSDSMMPQAPVSGAQSLHLYARLSLSGNVVAGPGDMTSSPYLAPLKSTKEVSLSLPTSQ